LVALDRLHARASQNGDAEVAASLEQLSRCWEAYAFADGEKPEQFAWALSTSEPACRATREGSSGWAPPAR
jgi:hypothetical protein